MTLPNKLDRLMRLRGFTQQALADALKQDGIAVSQRAVSGWLKGAEPRPHVAHALAKLFGVPVECLLGDEFDLPEGSTTPTFRGFKGTPPVVAGMRRTVENAKADREANLKIFRRIDKLEVELKALREDVSRIV